MWHILFIEERGIYPFFQLLPTFHNNLDTEKEYLWGTDVLIFLIDNSTICNVVLMTVNINYMSLLYCPSLYKLTDNTEPFVSGYYVNACVMKKASSYYFIESRFIHFYFKNWLNALTASLKCAGQCNKELLYGRDKHSICVFNQSVDCSTDNTISSANSFVFAQNIKGNQRNLHIKRFHLMSLWTYIFLSTIANILLFFL